MPGLELDAGDKPHDYHRNRERHHERKVGNHQPNQEGEAVHGRHHQPVKVTALYVRDHGGGARNTRNGEQDSHRQLKGAVVQARNILGEVLQRAHCHYVHEHGNDQSGNGGFGVPGNGPEGPFRNRQQVTEDSGSFPS